MPLVQLVTNLKSLKYGKDTPGGGYSGQPYIQAKIPDGLEPKSADFILRGGYLTVGDSLTDIKRLTKMFFDLKSPNGLFFIAKQNVLSNSAVRTQTSGVMNEGIYTPLNTLAQAGVIAFGGHLNKQGINPFEQTGAYAQGDYLYFNKVKPNPNDTQQASNEKNRLVSLYNAVNDNLAINNWNFSGVNLNVGDNNILSYRGGPGSILGVGNTNIRFADQRTGKNNPKYIPYKNYIIKSVLDDKQEGGLKINTGNGTKGWIKGGVYFDGNAKNVYFVDSDNFPNGLPSNNVNTPQSASLSNIPDGPLTWTPKQANPKSLDYLKTLDSPDNTGVSGKYIRLTGDRLVNNYNPDGKSIDDYFHNVYEPAIEGNTWPKNTPLIYANNTFTYNQSDLIETPKNDSKLAGSPQIQDFRAVLREKLGGFKNKNGRTSSEVGATPLSLDYQTQNIEKRVNIGGVNGPGARANNNYSSYTKGVQGPGRSGQPLDRINALPIYSSDNGPRTDGGVTDLITFRIGAINNSNPRVVDYIHFRAFIDSFTDNYTGDWSGINYLGRGEKFYTYNGFDRKISLSFKAAAQSKEELIPMYKKLNFLASNLAPDYSGEYGYMKGCFITLTVGGYLYEQPGFITNLSYDMITEMPWEIGINDTNGNQDPTVKQLSHMVKVGSFDFTPIHNFIPRKPLIGLGEDKTPDNPQGWVQESGVEYIALANPNDGSTNWSILGSVNLS
jgi:hypothetical protein